MMKLFFRLSILALLSILLAACANHAQMDADAAAQAAKQKQAAILNTQIALDYLQQNNMVAAKEKLLLALQQDPHSVPATSALAYYYELTNDMPSAAQYYLQAIDIASDKDRGGAYNNYGTFLCRQSNYAEADKYFQKAINDQQYVNTGRAYQNAGMCAHLAGDNKKAQTDLQQALFANPDLSNAMMQLAIVDYELGAYQAGYQQALNYFHSGAPNNPTILWITIRLAKVTGNNDVATAYANVLAKQFPTSNEYKQYLQTYSSNQAGGH